MCELALTFLFLFCLALIIIIFGIHRYKILYKAHGYVTDKYNEKIAIIQKQQKDYKDQERELIQKNQLLEIKGLVLDEILVRANDKNRDVRSAIKLYVRRDKDGKSEFLDGIRTITDSKAPGALKTIRRVYPNLSEDDIDLYCMSYLGVTVSTICFILDCTSASMYNKKCNLRKSLEITDSNITLKKHFDNVVNKYNRSLGLRIK